MLLSGVLFVLFLAGCWLYCLTDAVLTPKWEYRSRLAKSTWIYLIAVTLIIGAVAWLIARRSWRNRSWVSGPAGRGTLSGPGAGDFIWYPASAADAAARHPAGRSRQASPGHGAVPKGPDDDPEFLRQLDSRIRGTSTDPGELSASPTGHSAVPRAWCTWTPCCEQTQGGPASSFGPSVIFASLFVFFRPLETFQKDQN